MLVLGVTAGKHLSISREIRSSTCPSGCFNDPSELLLLLLVLLDELYLELELLRPLLPPDELPFTASIITRKIVITPKIIKIAPAAYIISAPMVNSSVTSGATFNKIIPTIILTMLRKTCIKTSVFFRFLFPNAFA